MRIGIRTAALVFMILLLSASGAAAQRMGRLIDDLLQLSQVSRAQFRPEQMDLSQLANTIVC